MKMNGRSAEVTHLHHPLEELYQQTAVFLQDTNTVSHTTDCCPIGPCSNYHPYDRIFDVRLQQVKMLRNRGWRSLRPDLVASLQHPTCSTLAAQRLYQFDNMSPSKSEIVFVQPSTPLSSPFVSTTPIFISTKSPLPM